MSFINSNLKNTYFALRHAHSIANEKHLILSYPENGLKNYGLSKKGEKQTLEKLKPAMLKEFKLTRKNTLTISSDFLRAQETAEIFCKLNYLEPPVFDKRLRERYFGEFEKMSSLNYQKIWQKDYENENHHYKNVESMTDVGKRIQDIINILEKKYKDLNIVLCSHGDILKITLAVIQNKKLTTDPQLVSFDNAEIRKLNFVNKNTK